MAEEKDTKDTPADASESKTTEEKAPQSTSPAEPKKKAATSKKKKATVDKDHAPAASGNDEAKIEAQGEPAQPEEDAEAPAADAEPQAEPEKAEPEEAEPAREEAEPKPAEKAKKPRRPAGKVHFLTGFPGFIGTRLVKKLAEEDPHARFVLLVEARLAERANATVRQLDAELQGFAARAELVTGDITAEHLGIEPERLAGLRGEVTTVWHLAALYDLAVEAQIAYRVNVVGTSNVLDFCESCATFQRLLYVSTCYVSGDRTGLILESELDEGQGHKNHYERTKFWAEVEVRRRMDHLPTVVLRPGIVVGDSRTGETDKYDGPYYLMTFLLRLPSWFPMVNVGRGDALVNLVPIDFVVEALAALAEQPDAEGKTFQLADANPMRARDIVSLLLKVLGRRPALATVPPSLFEKMLDNRRVRRLVGMPKESVVYFNHLARYDVTNTLEHLANTQVRCPHLSTYLSTLVDYVKRNPKKQFLDGREV
jgi:thioester reductase-like protein